MHKTRCTFSDNKGLGFALPSILQKLLDKMCFCLLHHHHQVILSEWNHVKFYKFANILVAISHSKLISAVKNYMAHKYKCKTMSNLSHKFHKNSSPNRLLLQKSRIFKTSCSVIRSMNHMRQHIKSYANTSHFIFQSFSPLSFTSQMPLDEQILLHPHRAHCQREPALGVLLWSFLGLVCDLKPSQFSFLSSNSYIYHPSHTQYKAGQ